MSEKNNAELIALLQSLDPADEADILRFVIVIKAARFKYCRRITAQEWDRLTEWQKRVILWQIRFMAGKAKAARYLRTLTGKAG